MKPVPEIFLFRRLTITLGLLAVAAAFFGILIAYFGISLIGGLNLGNKTIALSAALIWIFLGSVLAFHAAKPLKRPAGLLVLAVLILIAAIETIEFVFSIQGGHFFIETLFVSAGTIVIGPSSSPISPAAAGLVITATFALMFLIGGTLRSDKPIELPDVISSLGLIISLVSITFVLSYAYGNPLLYGTQFIPIAFFSALAAFFTGIAIVTAAGPGAFPARYMTGGSTSARLLRVFVPLVIGIILLENIAFVSLPSWFNIRDAVLLSASLVLFTLATALVVSRVSRDMGRALDKAEQELVRKNEELGAMNEELTAIDEELRQTNDNLQLHERQLVQSNDELNALNEELTATQEELRQNIEELIRAEKELRESEERYRLVADFTYDWEFWADPEGQLRYISPSADRITGRTVSRETSLEALLRTVVHPDDLDKLLAHLATEKSGRGAFDMEYRITRPDGEVRWIHHICQPVHGATGNFLGTRGSNRDITERKRAGEALLASEERYRTLFNGLIEGFCIIEMVFDGAGRAVDYRFLEVNAAFEAQTGLHDVQGKLMRELAPDHEEYWFEIYGNIALTGKPAKFENEARALRRWFEVRAFRIGGQESRKVAICFNDITERKLIEEQLKATLKRFYQILSGMPYGILLVTDDNRVEFANPAFCEIFGLEDSPADLTNLSADEMLGKIRSAYQDPDAAVARIGEIVRYGALVRNEDVAMRGGRVFLRDFIPIHMGGKEYGRLWIHSDITNRREAEEAMRVSEEKFRVLFTQMVEGSALHELVFSASGDPVDYRILDINPAFEHILGLRRDEVIGKTSTEAYSVDIPPYLDIYSRVAVTGQPEEFEVFFAPMKKHFSISVYSAEHGKFATLFTDITERKRAEEETWKLHTLVQEEKDRLSALVQSITDEIWFADTQKKFTLANPAALREFDTGLTNVRDVEDFARSLEVYRGDGTPRPVEEAPPLRALRGEVVKNFEELVRTPGHGELRYRQVSAAPVRDARGTIIGSVSVVRDVTENKKAEQELKQKNEDLNALNEELTAAQEELHQNIDELSRREQDLSKALAEKEVLLSEIHHRVKNNLTAFISLLSLEGSTEDTPAGKMLKQDLQNRARSMALIHEILYRTNMYDEVDMGMYLTTLVDQIANSFRMAKGVKTIVDAHGVMLDIPRATPAGLIVNELVTNSFKYAFPESFDSAVVRNAPPTITVTFAKDGGEYLMIVRDNGIGLPPGFDLTTTRTLGLKLVNFLAKHQMRAKIDVRADKGTEFIFRLNT